MLDLILCIMHQIDIVPQLSTLENGINAFKRTPFVLKTTWKLAIGFCT